MQQREDVGACAQARPSAELRVLEGQVQAALSKSEALHERFQDAQLQLAGLAARCQTLAQVKLLQA